MTLVNLTEALRGAHTQRYAVAAFNDVNALYARAIIRAAEKAHSPVILMVADLHLKYVDLEEMTPYLANVCDKASVPVVLMLDHGASISSIARAIRSGFTAVMFDGSRLPYEENVERTRHIAEFAHAAGVSVEGELGHVAGHEGGAEGAVPGDTQLFTDPDQARDFVARTGVDCLAVSVGTKHGFYTSEVRLDLERLGIIHQRVGTPLAIHGGSGLSDSEFRGLIDSGAAKINYYTAMAATAARTAREVLQTQPELLHLPDVLTVVDEAVEGEVTHVLSVFGSAGRGFSQKQN